MFESVASTSSILLEGAGMLVFLLTSFYLVLKSSSSTVFHSPGETTVMKLHIKTSLYMYIWHISQLEQTIRRLHHIVTYSM